MDSFAELEFAVLNIDYMNRLNRHLSKYKTTLSYSKEEVEIINQIESLYDTAGDPCGLIQLIYKMISIIDKKNNVLSKIVGFIDHINGDDKTKYTELRFVFIEAINSHTVYRDTLIDLLIELNP